MHFIFFILLFLEKKARSFFLLYKNTICAVHLFLYLVIFSFFLEVFKHCTLGEIKTRKKKKSYLSLRKIKYLLVIILYTTMKHANQIVGNIHYVNLFLSYDLLFTNIPVISYYFNAQLEAIGINCDPSLIELRDLPPRRNMDPKDNNRVFLWGIINDSGKKYDVTGPEQNWRK